MQNLLIATRSARMAIHGLMRDAVKVCNRSSGEDPFVTRCPRRPRRLPPSLARQNSGAGARLICSSCQAKRAPLAEKYIRVSRVWHYGKLAGPELIYGFRGSMAALQAPLSTLRRAPRHALRMTRGQFDLLFLSC